MTAAVERELSGEQADALNAYVPRLPIESVGESSLDTLRRPRRTLVFRRLWRNILDPAFKALLEKA